MSLKHIYGEDLAVSFMDIFKSSKTLRMEREAAARKRAELAEKKRKITAGLEALAQNPDRKDEKPAEKKEHTVYMVPPNPNPGGQIVAGPRSPTNNATGAAHIIPGSDWTPEQDRELCRLKSERTEWKAISAALGKPMHELKARWKQMRSDDLVDESPAQNQKPKNAANSGGKKGGGGGEGREQSPPPKTKGSAKKMLSDLDLEEKLTIDELVLLHSLATKFEDEKWIRIISKFFDRTGKRINAEDAKAYLGRTKL